MRIVAASALAAVLAIAVAVTLLTYSASAVNPFTPTSAVRMCDALPGTFVDPQIAGSTSCT